MTTQSYQVLARKYRPLKFADLAGQDVLVRTLSNAFKNNRVPHAILLTGTRGIGKTTTARLIARALNCTGERPPEAPFEPCGTCTTCLDILQDRHIDVLEMDAASRSGVDDIRDILETIPYKPTAGAFKVYIIDEVHMLSKSAFNALLKTLEEPPAHAKFIFATTEFHKIPDTIVSRCMRFDLKPFDASTLQQLVKKVCTQEGFPMEDEAQSLISQAGNGSARDTLSLLERALSLGDGSLKTLVVQEMLGLSDQGDLLTLMEHLVQGHMPGALSHYQTMVAGGADGKRILEQLALALYGATLMMGGVTPPQDTLSPVVIEGLRPLLQGVAMPVILRLWQVVQRGLVELSTLAHTPQACEMIIVRLCFLAHPQEVTISQQAGPIAVALQRQQRVEKIEDFTDLIALLGRKKEPLLKAFLEHDVALISFDPQGHLMTIKLLPTGSREMLSQLRSFLNELTGESWGIEIDEKAPEDILSIKQTEKKVQAEKVEKATQDPLVQKILTSFPGSQVAEVLPVAGESKI